MLFRSLLYDPQIIESLTVTQVNDFFVNTASVVLLNTQDTPQGRATFIEALRPGTVAQKGAGHIVNIQFIVKKTAPTTIKFLQKTIVTTPHATESILGKTTDLTIK